MISRETDERRSRPFCRQMIGKKKLAASVNIILSADNLDDICILAQGTRAIVVMDFGLPWRTAKRKGAS